MHSIHNCCTSHSRCLQ